MRKKRKGSETDATEDVQDEIAVASCESRSSNLRSHYSLEDYNRIRKRCKEGVDDEPVSSCKSRLAAIATAPPCGASSSLVLPGRGLKRKIGCIDAATQIGRKNKIEDDYVKGDTIGRGKFGSVWLCRSKVTGVEFACKTLRKGEETVHREVEIMQHLSGHPGVVTLRAVYEESDCFHLVMELCTGGRLIDQMAEEGRYSEHRAANIFKDVMLVIKYCHDMGVVHRDIKPENILLMSTGKGGVGTCCQSTYLKEMQEGGITEFLECDFVGSRCVIDQSDQFRQRGQTLSGLAGSPAYVAPDVLLGNYSEKVDIWSAGVLLHALLVGVLPFQGDSLEAVFEAIKNIKLDFHSGLWQSVSKAARDLVARMLTRDVSARITADEVLRHPWILFYTERTLKTFSVKSKLKNQVTSSQPANAAALVLSGNKVGGDSVGEGMNQHWSSSCKSEEQDECGLVDALTVAISHVKISEPKRSRLCGPTGPMEQQCSSNLTANNLCRAF